MIPKVSLSLFLEKDKAVKSIVFKLRILNLGFQGKQTSERYIYFLREREQ